MEPGSTESRGMVFEAKKEPTLEVVPGGKDKRKEQEQEQEQVGLFGSTRDRKDQYRAFLLRELDVGLRTLPCIDRSSFS